jgi:hypothetical protein
VAGLLALSQVSPVSHAADEAAPVLAVTPLVGPTGSVFTFSYSCATAPTLEVLDQTGPTAASNRVDPPQTTNGVDYTQTVLVDAVGLFRAQLTCGGVPVASELLRVEPVKPACVDVDGNGTADNDGDALCDNWETDGIDADGDGLVDLVLHDENGDGVVDPGEAADPNVKDVFVEVDFMGPLRPRDWALARVESAFAAAPEPIRLHVEVGDAVPFAPNTRFVACAVAGCAPDTAGFVDLKAAFFGTAAERGSAGAAQALAAKAFVFHYALWVNHFTYENGAGGFSGASEQLGNDIVISLGDWGAQPGGTPQQQMGTFMHELGHNLGLLHGGGDNVNCKPNYLSVMNYLYQLEGYYVGARPLDYSRSAAPTLDESALVEAAGIAEPSRWTAAYGPAPLATTRTGVPVDWNRNGVIDAAPVVADVNQLDAVCPGAGSVLTGWNDWASLQFAFYDNVNTFAEGIGQPVG